MGKIFRIAAFIIGFLSLGTDTIATHNRAGEIVYRYLGDFTFEITIITYTKISGTSGDADRCALGIDFGDNTTDSIPRTNGTLPCGDFPGALNGVDIGNDIRRNEYRTTHRYPGASSYHVQVSDPNRNGGIENITNSIDQAFYIDCLITMDIATGANNTPILTFPPIDQGCLNKVFEHNPGAVDTDGDSLVYSLIPCRGANGAEIPYKHPDQVQPGPGNNISIDASTGTVTWDSPKKTGQYNLCIKIEEYRRSPTSGKVFLVGYTTRDMQFRIQECPENDPPDIYLIPNLCIEAGQAGSDSIKATDANGHSIDLTAEGLPMEIAPNPAVFVPGTGSGDATAYFSWEPTCMDVRKKPYLIYLRSSELTTHEQLADYETMEVTVVSPAVTGTMANPQGSSIVLNWDPSLCTNNSGYDIYRYTDSIGYVHAECETGVPGGTGYELIGHMDGAGSTTFTDDNDGAGLTHGQRYCYMVVTTFADGAESYPSVEFCAELIRDIPILNKVSVNMTDSARGEDSIAWFHPVDLNTDLVQGPYSYRLSRGTSIDGPFETIAEFGPADDFYDLDTVFVDTGLNTLRNQYIYRIALLNIGEEMGHSALATSIFLSSEPSDNTLSLSWDVNVPWTNQQFAVYRFLNHPPDSVNVAKLISVVQEPFFEDSNLANLREYRYFVRSTGNYSSTGLPETLYNNSQIHTGVPIDNEPPCSPPNKFIIGDCSLDEVEISWNNPNTYCEDTDDVLKYRIYYSPKLGDPMELLEEKDDPLDTVFTVLDEYSIAGCYSIIAVDSFDNESPFQDPLCIDNCPMYELPNVFTPGGDNINDLFKPFPYKYVEDIQITIYNRWGKEVFSTNDPDINWDGRDKSSGKLVPDGVYYYVCTVNEIRLVGIVPRELKGYVHIFHEAQRPMAN